MWWWRRIPNLPFFYLVYRAWSHWRALSGSQHLNFLLDKKLITPSPSPMLDGLYAAEEVLGSAKTSGTATTPTVEGAEDVVGEEPETMLLQQYNSSLIAKALDIPELTVELERAIWQVDTAIKTKAGVVAEEKAEADGKAAEAKALNSKAEEEEANRK